VDREEKHVETKQRFVSNLGFFIFATNVGKCRKANLGSLAKIARLIPAFNLTIRPTQPTAK
jgi:hypothetical protein